MKVCRRCGLEKPFVDYNRRAKSKDGHQHYCRLCQNLNSRADYAVHQPRYVRTAQANSRVRRVGLGRLVHEYLATHPCVDCGEADPVVLTFDHVRGVKEQAISQMVSKAFSSTRVFAEIAKCDVRCANCHLRRTASQLGWYSWSEPEMVMEPPC